MDENIKRTDPALHFIPLSYNVYQRRLMIEILEAGIDFKKINPLDLTEFIINGRPSVAFDEKELGPSNVELNRRLQEFRR